MKKVEELWSSGNYDHKNITNKSSREIPKEILEEIENKGVTTEMLERLGVPVFKYKTQITIHGLFPELMKNYVFGYKNIFQNQNLSIGVKYQAVDGSKKERIYTILKHFGWSINHNSTDWYAYKISESFNTKTEYLEVLKTKKAELEKIDKSLFHGTVGVHLSGLYGVYYLVSYVNIAAIKEETVVPCIENITGFPYDIVMFKIQEIERIKTEKREAAEKEREAAEKEFREKSKPVIEAFTAKLIQAGYTRYEKQPIVPGLQGISFRCTKETYEITFEKLVYGKTAKQKKFRRGTITVDSFEELVKDHNFEECYYKREINETKVTGWLKLPPEPEKPVQKKRETPEPKTGIQFGSYNMNCWVVFGETYPIKNKLKEMGGIFNFRLSCGPGWLFLKSKITIEQLKEKLS